MSTPFPDARRVGQSEGRGLAAAGLKRNFKYVQHICQIIGRDEVVSDPGASTSVLLFQGGTGRQVRQVSLASVKPCERRKLLSQ